MRTRGIQKGEGGRKSRAYFSPGGAGVESTAPNFQRPLRKRVADMKHGFESRWGHQPDFSGGFPVRILIPPCRDQNPRLVPRLVEDADDLLQLVLRDPRVHRRRLNVRVAQVLLHHAQIAAGAPMQLDPAGMTERMRMKLGETRTPTK